MTALLIAGVALLALAFPLMKILEKCGSRWSNLALALCVFFGLLCLGLFASL